MEFSSHLLRNCWFLAGPTASGKSATALMLAQTLHGEIISLDSMAIYRSMDIGTAKPSRDERRQVPHHLIDVADPHEQFSVTEFVRLAAISASDIVARGRTPIFVGGTGLYLRSILRGMFEGPEADWELRNSLERQARELGPQWLHDRLAACDPATAARLHLNDMRRMIRAIEVFELTGRPLSEDQHHGPLPLSEQPQAIVWLEPPRAWLRDRINRRVDQMMNAGWLEETRQLIERVPPPSRTARQALGYRELIRHLEGELTLREAVELTRIATRQFAKRQHTWFRNLEECQALPMTGTESPEILRDRILQIAADRQAASHSQQ
jgi:tRNA dimethylallyltransferase